MAKRPNAVPASSEVRILSIATISTCTVRATGSLRRLMSTGRDGSNVPGGTPRGRSTVTRTRSVTTLVLCGRPHSESYHNCSCARCTVYSGSRLTAHRCNTPTCPAKIKPYRHNHKRDYNIPIACYLQF